MTDTTRDAFEAFAITCTVDDFDRPIDVVRADRDGPGDRLTYCERNTRRAWAMWQAATEKGKRQPLSDADIEALVLKCGGKWNGDVWCFEDADLHPFVRTVITATPQGKI